MKGHKTQQAHKLDHVMDLDIESKTEKIEKYFKEYHHMSMTFIMEGGQAMLFQGSYGGKSFAVKAFCKDDGAAENEYGMIS